MGILTLCMSYKLSACKKHVSKDTRFSYSILQATKIWRQKQSGVACYGNRVRLHYNVTLSPVYATG